MFPHVLTIFSSSSSEEDGEHEHKAIWYYSTKVQLAELMDYLDKEYWETDLYETLEEIREEVHTHMDITEDLTNKARGSNKCFLAAANGKLSSMLASGKFPGGGYTARCVGMLVRGT